jgi:hypothetical protein
MPKTLAALPSSQYATLLSLVCGQLLARSWLFCATFSSTWTSAPTVALLRSDWVEFHRTARETDGRDGRGGAKPGRMEDELRHGRHTKRRRVSRGAAVLSRGKAWKTEVMTMAMEEEDGRAIQLLRMRTISASTTTCRIGTSLRAFRTDRLLLELDPASRHPSSPTCPAAYLLTPRSDAMITHHVGRVMLMREA